MATPWRVRGARGALVHARVADLGEVQLLLRRQHVELVRRREVDVPPGVQEQLGNLPGVGPVIHASVLLERTQQYNYTC